VEIFVAVARPIAVVPTVSPLTAASSKEGYTLKESFPLRGVPDGVCKSCVPMQKA